MKIHTTNMKASANRLIKRANPKSSYRIGTNELPFLGTNYITQKRKKNKKRKHITPSSFTIILNPFGISIKQNEHLNKKHKILMLMIISKYRQKTNYLIRLLYKRNYIHLKHNTDNQSHDISEESYHHFHTAKCISRVTEVPRWIKSRTQALVNWIEKQIPIHIKKKADWEMDLPGAGSRTVALRVRVPDVRVPHFSISSLSQNAADELLQKPYSRMKTEETLWKLLYLYFIFICAENPNADLEIYWFGILGFFFFFLLTLETPSLQTIERRWVGNLGLAIKEEAQKTNSVAKCSSPRNVMNIGSTNETLWKCWC